MIQVQEGQCGVCAHFGEHAPAEEPKLVQIRANRQAPEDLTEACGHPRNLPLHLVVTANSGCNGFEPAPVQ